MAESNRFIILREDLVQDPVTIITEGLLIGRFPECELRLNHPSVSRIQAGIKEAEGNFYIFNLRASNPIKLNEKVVEENEALAAGDTVAIGPFLLDLDRSDDALVIKVSIQIGRQVDAADAGAAHLGTQKLPDLESQLLAGKKRPATTRAAPLPGTKALDIFWDKRIREAGKIARPSQLRPRSLARTGKAKFNWSATTDLARRWPWSFLMWGIIVVGLLSVTAAYWYAAAYAPGPLSVAHTRGRLSLTPPIAARANGNSCTTCHSFIDSMEAACADCHRAKAFVATVIEPHRAAGIGCTTCHAEHRGADVSLITAALLTCTDCHNDQNPDSYSGKRVGTPHGGDLGYPVVAARWDWEGLAAADWSLKQLAVERLSGDTDDLWRSKQFHAIHLYRVRAVSGLAGNARGELSCSSCHKTFNPIDRATPRQTCAICHNGRVDADTGSVVIAADRPNCTSCHVQHVQSKRHWNPSLMVDLNR